MCPFFVYKSDFCLRVVKINPWYDSNETKSEERSNLTCVGMNRRRGAVRKME